MISSSTINYNRPTMTAKVDFYNLLVLYFKASQKFGKQPNAKQCALAQMINTFGNDNMQNAQHTKFNHFDNDTINRLRPMHKRKARLYNLLVAYADNGRFDVFERLLKSIHAINIESSKTPSNYTAMIALLGFEDGNNGLDIQHLLLDESYDEICCNCFIDSVSGTVCTDSAAQQVDSEITQKVREEDEKKVRNYTISLNISATKKELDEFISYMEENNKNLKSVEYTEK